jgi:hypothetical protein
MDAPGNTVLIGDLFPTGKTVVHASCSVRSESSMTVRTFEAATVSSARLNF